MGNTRLDAPTNSVLGAVVLAIALVLAACGGGADDTSTDGESGNDGQSNVQSDDASSSGDNDSGEDLSDAIVFGGGGSFIFDGEEMPIDSATCALFGDEVDVGTISPAGHRVLISTNGRNPISAQILDPDSVQWFPQDASGDEAERDGGTFTSNPRPYFNNMDDRIVEASFTVECP